MKKLIGALAITTAALATTAAYAETTVDEQRARLEMLLTADAPVAASQTAPSSSFEAASESYGTSASDRWAEYYTTNNERDRTGR